MQVLYQLDLRGPADAEAIRAGLEHGPDDEPTQEEAFQLATTAYEHRGEADKLVAELAPQWPTHRQPPVDRAILRLSFYEMASQIVPVKVAINEAIELAKEYGTEQSPSFINGVLDKMARRLPSVPLPAPDPLHPKAADHDHPHAPATPLDPWLADALRNPKPPTPGNPGSSGGGALG